MPATEKPKKQQAGKLVAFRVSDEMWAALTEQGRAHGFPSPSLFARALTERAGGSREIDLGMMRVGEIRNRVQKNILRTLQSTFASFTVEEMLDGEGE